MPGCALHQGNFSSQPADRGRTTSPPPQKMLDIGELCRRDRLHGELSRRLHFWKGGGVGVAQSVPLRCCCRPPLQGRSASDEMVTRPQLCAATAQPALSTHQQAAEPSQACRARDWPFSQLRGEKENLPTAPWLSWAPAPSYLGDLRSRRLRACAHCTSRNARVPIRDALSR